MRTTLLYPNFLTQATIYDQAEAMWNMELEQLAKMHELHLSPYLSLVDAKGNKFRDGNPIISAFHSASNRGIRILQYSAEAAQDIFISAFFNELFIDENKPIQELVIDIVLSTTTKPIALDWIKHWLVLQIKRSTMEAILDKQRVLIAV